MSGNNGYHLVRIKRATGKKLKELAERFNRSMSGETEWLIEEAHGQTFMVVSIDELPHPDGAEPVPVVSIAPVE